MFDGDHSNFLGTACKQKPLWSASSHSGNWNNIDNQPTHDHSTRLIHQQVTMLIASYVTALFSLLI
jgi:hypothetical protein